MYLQTVEFITTCLFPASPDFHFPLSARFLFPVYAICRPGNVGELVKTLDLDSRLFLVSQRPTGDSPAACCDRPDWMSQNV